MPVSIPIVVTPTGALREIPVGTMLVDASMGGRLLLGQHGTIKGKSRSGSIVKATSALPRWTNVDKPFPNVQYPNPASPYPAGDYFNFAKAVIMGPDYSLANLQEVRNLTTWGSQPMPQFPYADGPEIAMVEEQGNGIWTTGSNSKIVECDSYEHRGSGIRQNFWTGALDGELSTTLGTIESCSVSRCWNGILIDYVDTQIYNCIVSDCRDCGLMSLVGQIQSANNHFYGARRAMQWGLQWDLTTGSACKSVNDTVADAPYGFLNVSSPHGSVWDMFIQHCWVAGASCSAITHFYDPRVLVPRSSTTKPNIIGIQFQWPSSTIFGGNFELNDLDFVTGTQVTGGAFLPNQCGGFGVQIENGDCNISDAYFYARGGPINSSPNANEQKQVGIIFKYISIADKYQWGNVVDGCHFIDFVNADCWGVYVEDHPSSPGTGGHAWRGGGNRVSIWGRGQSGTTHGFGTSDKRIKLPPYWHHPSTGSFAYGPNRVWLNGEELPEATYNTSGYPV